MSVTMSVPLVAPPRRVVHLTGGGADAEERCSGLDFDHAVRARQQPRSLEAILPLRVRRRCVSGVLVTAADELPKLKLDIRDAGFAAVPLVVEIRILEHRAGDRDRQRQLLQRHHTAGRAIDEPARVV